MEKQKNAAILIYPEFSNYEISIVSAIFKRFEKEIVVFRAEKGLVDSEEGFHFIPDKTFDEYDFLSRECIVEAPIDVNENIITAIGMSYREFAIEVRRKLKFDCDEGWFSGIRKPVKQEDYTFFRNVY